MDSNEDRYRKRIIERLDKQRAKGFNKYGQCLENNEASINERLEHLAQELTDALEYIEWIKEEIDWLLNTGKLPKPYGPLPLGLYRNNRNGKLYRVLGVTEQEVIYISEDGQLWKRPCDDWFGLNRDGQLRFKMIGDDRTIMYPKEAD